MSTKLVFEDDSKKLIFEDRTPKLVFADEFKKLIFDIVQQLTGIGVMKIGTTNIVG